MEQGYEPPVICGRKKPGLGPDLVGLFKDWFFAGTVLVGRPPA